MKKSLFLLMTLAFVILFSACPKKDDDNAEPKLADFYMYTSPDDPQICKAIHPDGTEVVYQGTKDRDGMPLSITSHTVLFPGETEPYFVKINDEGIPSEVFANNGCVFQFVWESTTEVIITAISPSGEIEARTPIDFSGDGLKHQVNKEIKNIRSGIQPEIEVTSIPITNKDAGDLKSGHLTVSVEKCGLPVDDALVSVRIQPWDGGVIILPQSINFTNYYSVPAPDIVEEPVDYHKMCTSIVGSLDKVGPYVKSIDPTAACTMLGAVLDGITGPSGEAVLIKQACEYVWRAIQAYSETLGQSPGDGGKSISEYMCDKILTSYQNPPPSATYQARAIAYIPGEGSTDGGWKAYTPGQDLLWDIQASGEKKIKKFKTSPFDPAPGQNYTASAEIYCPEQTGTDVTISVVGSDGYTNSKTVTLYEASWVQSVSLSVPGAEAGVTDKITITIEDGPTKVIGIVF